MPFRRSSLIVGFVGMKRSGKTATMREVIRATGAKDPQARFLIWDSGRVSGQFASWSERYSGFGRKRIYHEPGSLPQKFVQIYEKEKDLKDLYKMYPAKKYHLFQIPDFDLFLDTCFSVGQGTVVIDEIDQVSGKSSLRPLLDQLINTGAHQDGKFGQGLDLFWAARRFAKVHNDLIANTDVLFIHKTLRQADTDRYVTEFDLKWPEGEDPSEFSNQWPDIEFLRFDHQLLFEGSESEQLIVEGLNRPHLQKEKKI